MKGNSPGISPFSLAVSSLVYKGFTAIPCRGRAGEGVREVLEGQGRGVEFTCLGGVPREGLLRILSFELLLREFCPRPVQGDSVRPPET